MKCVSKHKDLQKFGPKLNKYESFSASWSYRDPQLQVAENLNYLI